MRQLRLALTAVLMVLGLAAFAAACGGDDDSVAEGPAARRPRATT